MNKYNRAALNNFLDEINGGYIKTKLNEHFQSAVVYQYLEKTFPQHIMNFGQIMEREYMNTDLITQRYGFDQNIRKQVQCLNGMFIDYMKNFIHQNVLQTDRREQIIGNRTFFNNDGLKANAGSIVSHAPRTRVCDQDTRDVDDPALYFFNNSNERPYMHKELPGDNPRFRRGLNKSVTSIGDNTADNHLDRQWFAHRAPQIRDDAVGEITRGQWQPCSQHCLKTPTCPGCGLETMSSAVQNGAAGCAQVPQTQQGNSLCSYEAGNVSFGKGYSYSGVPDMVEPGVYEDRFNGDSPEYSGNHVDRLLSTPMIQTLNKQYGETPVRPAIMSTYERGRGGARHPEIEGLRSGVDPQAQKLWHTGDGFMDQSNPAEMKKLIERRVFRSFNAAPACRACNAGSVCIKHPNGQSATSPVGRYGTNHGDEASEQIPFYERALYVRSHERDVDESVGGFENGCINRGYGADMESLYCRIPKRIPCGNRKSPMPGGYDNLDENPDWQFYVPG